MPELPDVESFKHVLDEHGLNKKIDHVEVGTPRILGKLPAAALVERLEGGRLVSSLRHGKHLFAKVDKGGWMTFHFGMTGGLIFVKGNAEDPPYTRVRLDFGPGGRLAYINRRMIGHVGFVEDAARFIEAEKLGPDALDPHFGFDAFKAAVEGTRRDVKAVLMDQEILAGIGNVWADEILFQAKLHPQTRMDALEPRQLKLIYEKVRDVLKTAVARGAGSEQMTDRMPKGYLLPERHKGGHCPRCGAALKTAKIGGRTTYFCANCQK